MPPKKADERSDEEKAIDVWRIKRLIKGLKEARGNGTSMISLIMPPKSQIAQIAKMLADEYGTASNIKSRVNRLSVLDAITSTQQKLKLIPKVPDNGLVLYCGTILTDEGKEKKVTIALEPFKPINTSLYLCDNKFHVDPLLSLLESDDKFGFIIMDGSGALYGTLCGNSREVLHKFNVELPKKHGRGGQSALRFARLRLEKRHNYLRKVAETATQIFITNDVPNVNGVIVAGSADFKKELAESDMFDPRLQAILVNIVDIAYGGELGFAQAIELSQECLTNVKFIKEKKVLNDYFEQISQDTGKYVFGIHETLKSLEMGAVENLILWENLDVTKFKIYENVTKEDGTIEKKPHEYYMTPEQQKGPEFEKMFVDETGAKLEFEEISLLEWLAEHYTDFGCKLEFVSDQTSEGAQFVKGFGGIGGLLRYKVDSSEAAEHDSADDHHAPNAKDEESDEDDLDAFI